MLPLPGPHSVLPPTKARVVIADLRDGGFFYWLLRLYLFAFLGLGMIVSYALVGVYLHFAPNIPDLPDLRTYAEKAPGITTLYAWDGTPLSELASERREVIPLSQVPKVLIDAFVATEDRRFFDHSGLDLRGFVRALRENLRAGRVTQGGSTITQQVAKAFLSPERSFSRKVREAILARRLEARYTKREILSLYLNQIFLGHGAFGVQAAARTYFDRDVWDLTLPELALLAGLAKAPSRFSPVEHPEAALGRRNQVLVNMVESGLLKKEAAEPLYDQPLSLTLRREYSRDVAPYFVEQVRRDLIKQIGQAQLYKGGYRVETSVLPYVDVQAGDSVDYVVRKLDKRQGWRGPQAQLSGELREVFLERARALYEAPLLEDTLYLGLVDEVRGDGAKVLVGGHVLSLPLRNMDWAARYSARDATNDHTISSATEALHRGDVIWVKLARRSCITRFSEFTYNEIGDAVWQAESCDGKSERASVARLEQAPRPQGSIFSFDLNNGYVLAMAGGNDFDRSEFNRVVQACRQPGSAYKPIYYSLALERGYSFDTHWNDRVKAEIDPVTGEMWLPQNIDGSYGQQVTLERALVWSKNPPSIEIFKLLGAKDVEAWARVLGMTTPIHPDDALALGASCVRIDELSRSFAIFARNGRPSHNVYVRRVLGRRGQVLIDHSAWDDPMLDGASRLDRVMAVAGEIERPVIAERTAWLTGTLLREVVSQGHSGPIRAAKITAAGKTGTSSRTSDVWFVGYTSHWLTTAWIGDDTYERQLGYKDASFTLSVPLWARFMYSTTHDQVTAELPLWRPPGVKPSDHGGPLKAGFPPPPPTGVDEDALPDKLKGLPTGSVEKTKPAKQ